MHNFSAEVAGYDWETGRHYNFSRCSHCGIMTESYEHGDFGAQARAEAVFNNFVECKSIEDVLNEIEAELAKPVSSIFR